MARPTHVHTIDYVASLIAENIELLLQIASNSGNIDCGDIICVHDGSEDGITTFTERGIESLQELITDIRIWEGGVRQFLIDEQCDPEKIEHIIADEPVSEVRPPPRATYPETSWGVLPLVTILFLFVSRKSPFPDVSGPASITADVSFKVRLESGTNRISTTGLSFLILSRRCHLTCLPRSFGASPLSSCLAGIHVALFERSKETSH